MAGHDTKAAGSKHSTADSGGIVTALGDELTPEQMAANDAFDIGPYFINLFWHEPFFYSIYKFTNRIMSRKIVPTAGVTVVKDRPTLVWNQDFMASMTKLQVSGILKHEAYHLIYNHCTERRRDPHFVWNWAADLSINGSIPRNELPAQGLFPGSPLARPKPEEWAKMTPDKRARFEKLSALIASFPVGKAAEWYFERLLEDPEIQKMVEEAKEAEAQGKALAEAIGKAIADAMSGDSHDGWGKAFDEDGNEVPMSEGVRQLIEGEIREALREAVSRADGSNRWGSVPAEMQSSIRALVSTEVDWRALLRQFVGMSRRSNSRNSRKKVNRKVPYVFPGRTRNYTANIAVYVDQSGSVDERSLELFYGELRSLAKRTTFHFFPFDTEVDVKNGFIWKKGQTKAGLLRFRCGGTDFQSCVDHAHKNKDIYDGMIIASDGECSKPTPSRMRRAYIICPNNKLYFEPEPTDIVIQMKDDKKKD